MPETSFVSRILELLGYPEHCQNHTASDIRCRPNVAVVFFFFAVLFATVPFVSRARGIIVLVYCQEWKDLSDGDVYHMFAVVRGCASAVATTQGLWVVACGRIRSAIEQAQKLLLYPCGMVYMKAGDFPRARQLLEEYLSMMRSVYGDMDHRRMAATLRALGQVSLLAGDLDHAKQNLEESLDMKRSLNKEDRADPDIAAVLGELGQASLLAKDFAPAKQYLQESLEMKCSLYGVGTCPETAATLQILGQASLQSGDLDEAKQHLEACLQMLRSLHGKDDRTDIAATLHALGVVARQLGDLEHAKQHLEECLRMTRCLCGDEDSSGIALTLRELGEVSQQAGDTTAAKEYLDESLRIMRSLASPDSAVSDVSGRSGGSTISGHLALYRGFSFSLGVQVCSVLMCWSCAAPLFHHIGL